MKAVEKPGATSATLERLLQSEGFGSRRDCHVLVRDGHVLVDGLVCQNPTQRFPVDAVSIEVDGLAWVTRARAVLMLNKPVGFECSRSPRNYPGVLSLLPPQLARRGVQPVGRLDADTQGLLLLTDDGKLNHALSSPKRKVAKVYEAGLKHPADVTLVEKLLGGVVLRDDPAPAIAHAAELIDPQCLRLSVSEGRYHFVRRMVAAAGNRVETLRRVAIGGLSLPADLPEGAWRWVTAEEERLLMVPYDSEN